MNNKKTSKINTARLIEDLEKFIYQNSELVIESAARGWEFSNDFDKSFFDNSPEEKLDTNNLKKEAKLEIDEENIKKFDHTKRDLLGELSNITDMRERWLKTKKLTSLNHINLILDSFPQNQRNQAKDEVIKLLSGEKLTIVILGAGCVGLFLANILKYQLKDDVEILICENRCYKTGMKKPYSRQWLTNISMSLFELVDPQIIELLDFFGDKCSFGRDEKYMGVTINVFETLLLLSCKKLGVSFYFEPKMNFDFIRDTSTDLIFDATGGKIDHLYPDTDAPKEQKISLSAIQGSELGYKSFGLNLINSNKKNTTDFTLREKNKRHYVYLGNKKIKYSLFKITNIPTSYHKSIMEFVHVNNEDNLFYVWLGNLSPSINKALIIINLDKIAAKKISELIEYPVTLDIFAKFSKNDTHIMDNRILKMIEMLQQLNKDSENIYIEPPFIYEPNIKLPSEKLPRLFSVAMIPSGDSFYCGHAKVGNGLGYHMQYTTSLVKQIITSVKQTTQSSIQETLARGVQAHQKGMLQEAENCYRSIIAQQKNHPDANHNMGVIATVVGKSELSIAYFKIAIESNPRHNQYWVSMIESLINLGRISDASSVLQQARNIGAKGDQFDKLEKRL